MANHETKGNIGVTSENIFPVIKKFLYSDHEIFLRELVSNAIDATQKLKTLSSVGDFKGELGDLSVRIRIEDGKLIVSDRGIGMTAEEIERYINQIAFSGAEEFVQKYQNNASAIIGHFGLGFYSSFMVAKKVEIVTTSYKDGAVAMKWSCEGSRHRHYLIYRRRKQGISREEQDHLAAEQILPLSARPHRLRKEAGVERRSIRRYGRGSDR